MKLRIKSMIWNIRKKKTFNQNRKEKNSKKKNKDRFKSLWNNFKSTNTRFIEMLEGEEKEQEIENLFEKNNEKKLP